MAEKFFEGIWNQFDEIGLLIGMERVPGETNIEFRNRIVGHATYDSTSQGLLNYISEALLSKTYNITKRKEFFTADGRQPLSFSDYQSLTSPNLPFYNPKVIVGNTTWTILPTADDQKDTITVGIISWSLWKQPNGSYDQVWTTDYVPAGDVQLKYMWKDSGGVLHVIHENSKILTWESAQIVEAYPPEVRL